MTSASRSNQFDVLELIESELEVDEMNAVDVVQEVVEITVDLGAANNVWPIRKKGVTRTGGEDSEPGVSNWQSDKCGRRCEIGIRSERQKN